MKYIINVIRKIVRGLRLRYGNHINPSYSQDGEDVVLLSHFKHIKENMASGVYVDIGAHHPLRFNNTKIFYDLGWRGINIDGLDGPPVSGYLSAQ